MESSLVKIVIVSLVIAFGIASGGCVVEDADYGEFGDEHSDSSASNPQLAYFLPLIQVGDIILTSNESGIGCDFLSDVVNEVTRLTYCHAMLVVGNNNGAITTIEAAGPGQNVDFFYNRQEKLFHSSKVAVLRVVDAAGLALHPAMTTGVVRYASNALRGLPYSTPPVTEGDNGVYCSMVPWLAYLQAGLDLDQGVVPYGITPDELYTSAFTRPIHQSRLN